jgi:hypothetical protein
MVIAIALHILLNAKVGGTPLLLSMFSRHFREIDGPTLWRSHISAWWSVRACRRAWQSSFRTVPGLMILEMAILASLAVAWVISAIKQFSS